MGNFKYNNNNNWKKPRSHIRRNDSCVDGPCVDRKLTEYQLEAKFCITVGGISIRKVVENQRSMFLHENVLKWNDSAVEEAFKEAKTRFLAKEQGQPCDVKLPDPDIFIDQIDWDCKIDAKLLSDLEDLELESEQLDGGVITGFPVTVPHYDLTPTGWGDAEDVKPPQEETFGNENWDENENWNEHGVKMEARVSSNGWEGENRVNGSTRNGYRNNREYCAKGKHSEHGRQYNVSDEFNEKGGSSGWTPSRYKISRFQHNNYDQSHNYGAGQANFSCERPLFTWKPVGRYVRW